MKKISVLCLLVAVLFAFHGCSKSDEKVVAESPQKQMAPGPIIDTPSDVSQSAPGKRTPFQVVVPPDVPGVWTGVKITVTDKTDDSNKEHIVAVGDGIQIADSGLTVKIGPFLPDFKMSGQTITSSSADPNNPALGIAVMDNGKKVFPTTGEWGWVYAKFPTIHSFQHDRYIIALTEGIKK